MSAHPTSQASSHTRRPSDHDEAADAFRLAASLWLTDYTDQITTDYPAGAAGHTGEPGEQGATGHTGENPDPFSDPFSTPFDLPLPDSDEESTTATGINEDHEGYCAFLPGVNMPLPHRPTIKTLRVAGVLDGIEAQLGKLLRIKARFRAGEFASVFLLFEHGSVRAALLHKYDCHDVLNSRGEVAGVITNSLWKTGLIQEMNVHDAAPNWRDMVEERMRREKEGILPTFGKPRRLLRCATESIVKHEVVVGYVGNGKNDDEMWEDFPW